MPYTDHIKTKQTEGIQMTYYESAEGVTITHKRAIKELMMIIRTTYIAWYAMGLRHLYRT